jgi:hypothetical protein
MMAVTTSLDANGNLTITGDVNPDNVAIFGSLTSPGNGEVTIQGRNGTTVDGGASTTITGVLGDLIANFGEGTSIINVDNLYLGGRLRVESGDGNDVVVFGATGVVSAGGDCFVDLHAGNNTFRAEDYKVFMGASLAIENPIGPATLIGASARGAISVNRSPQVLMRGVTAGSTLAVQFSGAPINNIAIFTSSAQSLRVDVGSGQNSIYIDTCYAASRIEVLTRSIFLGSVPHVPEPAPYNIDDTITIARCQTPHIFVDTAGVSPFRPFHSGGNDTVQLYGNYVTGPATDNQGVIASARVETGDGNDTVNASYNIVLSQFLIGLADLDDTLGLVGNQVTGLMNADGGTGTNRLFLLGNQFAASSLSFFV